MSASAFIPLAYGRLLQRYLRVTRRVSSLATGYRPVIWSVSLALCWRQPRYWYTNQAPEAVAHPVGAYSRIRSHRATARMTSYTSKDFHHVASHLHPRIPSGLVIALRIPPGHQVFRAYAQTAGSHYRRPPARTCNQYQKSGLHRGQYGRHYARIQSSRFRHLSRPR